MEYATSACAVDATHSSEWAFARDLSHGEYTVQLALQLIADSVAEIGLRQGCK